MSRLPTSQTILAVGADLKNTVALVVRGDALVSQHIGDLEYVSAYEAFKSTGHALAAMYEGNWTDVVVAHDQHPHYASTAYAFESPARERVAVQHHRAHIASMLAERGALDTRLIGAAFDGIGYGDDGKIWGGEFLVGSVSEGFCRVASLRPYALAVATRRHGGRFRRRLGSFFDDYEQPDLAPAPFNFPKRYDQALRLARGGFRTFTSIIEARNVHFLQIAQPCLPASGRVFSPRCVNGGATG